MRSLIKLFTFIVFIGGTIFPIYALASSNSGAQASGEGGSPISGWTISNIHYQLSSDPSFIQSVSFDLDAPASTLSIKLNAESTTYTSCTNLSAFHWQCDFLASVSISSMDELRLIAVGN